MGVDTAPWLELPPQEGSNDGPPKILPRPTPAPEATRTENSAKKNENGILESARRGDSEKSSFAVYLVKNNFARGRPPANV